MNIEVKSQKLLEFDKVCENLAELAHLSQSKELCLRAEIFDDSTKIQTMLKFTREAKQILDMAHDIPVGYVANIKEIKELLRSSYLVEEEIINIAKTIRSSRLVKNFIRENTEEDALLRHLSFNLFADKDFEEDIFNTFDENMEVRNDATAELKGLNASLREAEKTLKKRVSEMLSNSEFSKHLQEQIYTLRDERVVFQVKASDKSKVSGIVHDVSATNQTFYIEPASIVPLNNKIRETKSKIAAEIIRILVRLTEIIKNKLADIEKSVEVLGLIDYHFAKARYAVKLQAVEPELVDWQMLEFDKMRHPLIEDCIANDFSIGKDYKSLVITGSNTGGKTVALKTIGLFLLMTKAGMFLPCTNAKVYPYTKILSDIGDEQSITQSLSTFSSHMTNIIDIVNIADDKSFVVLDEMCAGTDPVEGAVLAQVILEYLAKKNVMSVITTHYGELKSLEYTNPYFKNASVEFNTATLKPTYRLIIGIPGLSNAISISSTLGLRKEITDEAKEILVTQKDPTILVVEKLQETQNKLAENLAETEVLKAQAEEIKKDYDDKLKVLKKEKKKTITAIKGKFDHELTSVKSEIKDILSEMRKEKSEKIARRSYARLAKIDSDLRHGLDEITDREKYVEINWDNVQIGDILMLKELHQEVKVISELDKNGSVMVQMGLIKTKIKKEKLAVPTGEAPKPKKAFQKSSESFSLKRYDISSELDLRGLRVEDALDKLENYLDTASLANLSPVYIIHGHGTGALKSAVRDYISSSPYVAKFRAGESTEGGDGVSVIEIK